MDNLRTSLDRLRRAGRPALVPFIMGGHPDLSTTSRLLLGLEAAGADVIEVGIPFSDPLADGPTIQLASAEALARGTTPGGVLGAVRAVRRRLRIPVVGLSYWNPILQYGRDGVRSFVQAARASGLSGLIVPDLPADEGAALRQAADREGLATIFLVAPTSGPARMRAIARASEGFIYYVSVAGTTGARRTLPRDLVHGVRRLKRLTRTPVYVGFGISTPSQAAAVAHVADGVIIGSALLQAMMRARNRTGAVRAAVSFIRRVRRAL